MVLVGNSGGEYGVRGWVVALNASDGSIAWKAYNTGPDKDVLLGADFHPFYAQDRGRDLGVTSWPPDAWKIGGGNVWGWISYDPDLNLIFHGTGNPGPWNPDQRPGDNKWTAGNFARNPDTGAGRWYYQWSPHDLYDHDGINENILLDVNWHGQMRKVLVHPERNRYVYMLDRTRLDAQRRGAHPGAVIGSVRRDKVFAQSQNHIRVESAAAGGGWHWRDWFARVESSRSLMPRVDLLLLAVGTTTLKCKCYNPLLTIAQPSSYSALAL